MEVSGTHPRSSTNFAAAWTTPRLLLRTPNRKRYGFKLKPATQPRPSSLDVQVEAANCLGILSSSLSLIVIGLRAFREKPFRVQETSPLLQWEFSLLEKTWSLGFSAYGSPIQIVTDVVELLKLLQVRLPPCSVLPLKRGGASVIRVSGRGTWLAVEVDRKLEVETESLELVLTYVERTIDALVAASRLNNFAFLHAGAVTWENNALLLPGGTFQGKSTLVAELVEQGATYVADDLAVVDELGQLQPYPRPMSLRTGELLPQRRLPANIATHTNRVTHLIFCTYHPPEAWPPEELSTSQAVVHLLRYTFGDPNLFGPRMRILARLAEGARCFRFRRADAPHAAKRLFSLMTSS